MKTKCVCLWSNRFCGTVTPDFDRKGNIVREPRGIGNPYLKSICVRGGYDHNAESIYGDIIPPIHMAITYAMSNSEDASRIIAGEQFGYVYGRFGNPTVRGLERCFAALEGGQAAIAFASGNAAHAALIAHFCSPGDNIVLHRDIDGGTNHLVGHRSKLTSHVEARFVEDPTDLDCWRVCIDEKTQFAFMEVPTNPHGNVYDIRGVANLLHMWGKPLVVDSTIATSIILRPLEHGADIVSHSLSKSAAGFSQAMGGILVGSSEQLLPISTVRCRRRTAATPEASTPLWKRITSSIVRRATRR